MARATPTQQAHATRPWEPCDQVASGDVPQSDSFERIIQVVALIAKGVVLSPETIDLSERHINYHKQAARILGLLDGEGAATQAGKAVATLAPNRQFDLLRIQFEMSRCGQAWLNFANVQGIEQIAPEQAEAFLRRRARLSNSMVARRGRCLRRWVRDLKTGAADDSADPGPPTRTSGL